MMRRPLNLPFVFVLFATLLAATQSSAAESELILIQRGNCPLLLTASHGGNEPVPDVAIRRGEGVSQFTVSRDLRTDVLTEQIANELNEQGFGRPYVVIAKFSRKYIDANRPADDAFEDDDAHDLYNDYHNSIKTARTEILEQWGRGVLLDVHGTSAEPSTIYRGTQDGRTAEHLRNRFGNDALRGKKSLFGRFAMNGFTVDPPVGSMRKESRRHRGGFTVRTYGSSDGGTFDAIQLELGAKLRERSSLEQTAKRIASSIKTFAADCLPTASSDKQVDVGRHLGMLVPAYSYPAGDGLKFWNALIDAASSIPMIVIANPNSGPGMRPDPNYKRIIEEVQQGGARVVGYVPTGYAKREPNEVKRDIDRWKEHYAGIDGFFFDEQSSDASDLAYYVTATTYARTKITEALVASNPGTVCEEAYFRDNIFDVICVFENAKGFDKFVAPSVGNNRDAPYLAALLHSKDDANVVTNIRGAASKGIRYIYITDDAMPNPWDTLPSYWSEELATVVQMNQQVE